MNRDAYSTPKEVFAVFNAEFNFAVDVAASRENALCGIYFSEECSALTRDWFPAGESWAGQYAWCNPPYSDIGPWVAKAAEQSAKGIGTVMLVMMDQSVGWYREAIKTCQEVRLVIGGRLSFIDPSTGKPAAGNNKGSMFIIWHPYGRTPVQYSHIERDEMLAAGRAILEQQETGPWCPGCGQNCDHVELAGFRTFCQPCFDKLPPFPKDGRGYNPEQQADGSWLWVTKEPELCAAKEGAAA